MRKPDEMRLREDSLAYRSRVKCLWCEEYKSPEDFVRNRNYKDGYHRRCKACHAAYMRRRLREMKAGTWKPTRMRHGVPNAIRVPSETDIAWAAGFLEGEAPSGGASVVCARVVEARVPMLLRWTQSPSAVCKKCLVGASF